MRMTDRTAAIAFALILATARGWAAPVESLLVNRVSFVNPAEPTATQMVNLLVKKGKLHLVSRDSIPGDSTKQVIDARAGFILGRLDVGGPANFIILGQDPRENPKIFLDTKQYAVLALMDGEIVLNALPAVDPTSNSDVEVETPREWFAYSAPPVALATSYRNVKRWNHYEAPFATVNLIGAVVLDRMQWVGQDSTSEGQVGDLDEYNGGEIRGLRFGAYGALNFDKPWIYTFAAATAAFDKGFDYEEDDGINVFDLRLDIPFYADTTIAIGKQKEPISMERLTGMINLPMQERASVSDSLFPSRNTGIVLSGMAFEGRSSWAAGVFNSWLDSDYSIGEYSTQFIGRGTVVPLVSDDESSLVHLGLGLRYTNAKLPLSYQTSPEFNLAPDYVATGTIEADDAMLYNAEASWRWGAFLLNGEYVFNQLYSDSAEDPGFQGYHVTASYVLSGEMRPYNERSGLFLPVPISRGVNRGGWGAWEVSARYSDVDLTEGTIEGGEMDIASLGLNWWLTPVASFGVNYRHVGLDREGERGSSDGVMTRIVLMLE